MSKNALSGAISGHKPIYVRFNIISGLNTIGGKTMHPRQYTIEGQNSRIYSVTLSEADCGLETLYTGALRNIRFGISYHIAKMEWSTLTPSPDPVRLVIADSDIASDLRQGQPLIAMNVCRPAATLQYDLYHIASVTIAYVMKPCHTQAPIAMNFVDLMRYHNLA